MAGVLHTAWDRIKMGAEAPVSFSELSLIKIGHFDGDAQ
jgi:hypothetical protein